MPERPELVQEEVETPLGRGQLIYWGNSALFRTGTYYDKTNQRDPNEPVPCLTINRVDYGGRVDLHVYDGEWGLFRHEPDRPSSTWQAVGMSRQDGYSMNDVSPAAGRKLRAELVPWLIEHVKANPELVLAGHRKRLSDARARAQSDLDLAQTKVNEVQAELAEIEAEAAAL